MRRAMTNSVRNWEKIKPGVGSLLGIQIENRSQRADYTIIIVTSNLCHIFAKVIIHDKRT